VRVRHPRIGVLGDVDRLDTLADDDMGHIHPLDELREPRLEVHPVVEDELRLRRSANIPRRRLVAVDLRSDLGDRLHPKMVTGDVLGDVSEHRERRQHDRTLVVSPCIVLAGCRASSKREREHGRCQQRQGTAGEETRVTWHG
jgi:hypothetical protein